MGLQILNRAQAFQPGCDLWVVPNEPENAVLQKMDWYLNFQLTRAHAHHTAELPQQIRFIMTENQMPEFHEKPLNTAPLMIAASRGLPTKRVVEISQPQSQSQSAQEWSDNVYKVWLDLDRPTMRIFLPQLINLNELKEHWKGSPHDDIQVVGG